MTSGHPRLAHRQQIVRGFVSRTLGVEAPAALHVEEAIAAYSTASRVEGSDA